MKWNDFVKKIRTERNISFKEALKVASPLWQQQKKDNKPAKNAKKRTKKKQKYEEPPEVTEFPKPTLPKTTRRKVASTSTRNVTSLGGRLDTELARRADKRRPTTRQRLQRKHSVRLDSAYKYVARKSKV